MAAQVLPHMVKAMKDGDPHVRKAAVGCTARLVQGTPHLAAEVLPHVVR